MATSTKNRSRLAAWVLVPVLAVGCIWAYVRSVQRDIVTAVRSYNAPRVRNALAAGADPNAKDDAGSPVLITALRNNDSEVAKVLLEAGADANSQAPDRSSALDLAFRTYNTDIMEAVCKRAKPTTKRKDVCDAVLWFAAGAGKVELARNMIALGADVNSQFSGNLAPSYATKPGTGETPLIHATNYGRIEMVTFLLDHGADVNITDGGSSALMRAAIHRHTDITLQLLRRGAKTEYRDPYFKQTAVQLASDERFGPRDQTIIRMLSKCH